LYRSKYSSEEKILIIKKVIEGKCSINTLAATYSLSRTALKDWVRNYRSFGSDAFNTKGWANRTIEEKEAAVLDYISGKGSLRDICIKYKILDTKILRRWILKYNGHEKLKASGTGGSTIMTRGRKTTFEERVEIVQYCIANNRNYTETSKKYQVSYQQARNYTVKYESDGVEALQDNRGKSKSENEMSELEQLRAENTRLQDLVRLHASENCFSFASCMLVFTYIFNR
jgi:transposase-like protein